MEKDKIQIYFSYSILLPNLHLVYLSYLEKQRMVESEKLIPEHFTTRTSSGFSSRNRLSLLRRATERENSFYVK